MVFRDHTAKLFQQLIALLVIQFVDIFREWAECKNALPSRDWVCSHNRMHGTKSLANILWATALLFVNFDSLGIGCSSLDEPVANKRRSQAFEELLVNLRESIIYFVARSPQRIATAFWKLRQAK